MPKSILLESIPHDLLLAFRHVGGGSWPVKIVFQAECSANDWEIRHPAPIQIFTTILGPFPVIYVPQRAERELP